MSSEKKEEKWMVYHDRKFYGVRQKQQRANEDRFRVIYGYMENICFRFFAVFDGHGGPGKLGHVNDYCVDHLHKRIGSKLTRTDLDNPILVTKAIKDAFISFDKEMFDLHKVGKLNYGTTCTAVLIDDIRGKIYQINLGDSASIIFNKDGIISETKDHKPTDELEANRVKKAGGFVKYNRIMGDLALSRAFGDYMYKNNINKNLEYDPYNAAVSAEPDVIIVDIIRPMTIILTSDAPYEDNSFTNKTLVELFSNCYRDRQADILQEKPRLELLNDIANRMVSKIAPRTTDDTTILLVSV